MTRNSLDALRRLAREALARPDLVQLVLNEATRTAAKRAAERAGINGREKVAVDALAQIRHMFGEGVFYRTLEEAGATPK